MTAPFCLGSARCLFIWGKIKGKKKPVSCTQLHKFSRKCLAYSKAGWCVSLVYSSHMLWICTGFLLSTIHAAFPLHFLWCLFTTPTLTGNFSGIHLPCPDPFSEPCLFSKPVIPPWAGLVAVSDPLCRKVITWPSQPVNPRLFLVPASQWSLHGIIGNF